MKRLLTLAIIVVVLGSTYSTYAADTKVNGRLYAFWQWDQHAGAHGMNEFALGRAYVTVKSKLSDFTSVRITTDLRSTDHDGKERYDIILKYGYLDWKPAFANGKMFLRIGLQPTQYIDYQNKLWGRRYLAKTISDMNKFLTSADLGMSVNIPLGEKGKTGVVSATVFNGTSYTNLEEQNKHKDLNLFARLNPVQSNSDFANSALVAQFYQGVQNRDITGDESASDYKNQLISFGGLLAYRNTFEFGSDLNWHTMGYGQGASDSTASGLSFHGTIFFEDMVEEGSLLRTLNLFGRVDLNDPNTDVDEDGNTYLIAGIECSPTKGFKASINFRSTSYQADDVTTEKQMFFNTLFKF